MGYSNYRKLKQVADKFSLNVKLEPLFAEKIVPVQASDWLKKAIEMAFSLPLSNEKVKSERLISPILSELHWSFRERVTLFSGEELSVSEENDLNGACDFFFAAKPHLYLLDAPIFALVEAKDEDMDWGIAQCAAQMMGAQFYNLQQGTESSLIWGCATTGSEWRFLLLSGKKFQVDTGLYSLNNLNELLGVFHHILSQI